MSYFKLSKLFYKNENEWKEEYNNRFNFFSTQHFNFLIKEYNRSVECPAFLCYTPELVQLLDKIYILNIDLMFKNPNLPPAALAQYTQSCMIEEIQASNEIEGVHSSRKEIRDAFQQLKNITKDRPSRFHSIVDKYVKLLNREKINFYTPKDVRKFYDSFILQEVTSENKKNAPDGEIFRKDSVEISTGTQKILHQGVYPEEKLITEMEKALNILNSRTYPLFIRIAIFHYLFGYLHPFYDGNGRTIRFITAYYIAVEFSPLVAFNLSLFIKRNIKTYYNMFQETNSSINCGDLTFFVTEFLKIIKESMEETIEYLSKRSLEYQLYINKIVNLKLSDKLTIELYAVLLQAALFTPLGATMQEITATINKSRNTILKRFENIPQSHILKDTSEKPHRFKLNLDAFK